MIKYNLQCDCNAEFESWFSSSSEYDILSKKKLITCIYCDSTNVKKSLMKPNITSKSNSSLTQNKEQRNLKKQLINIRKYIEKNCKNVGKDFSHEARNIHYDKKSLQGIYGQATPEETSELLDEGIEVATIPWIDKTEN